MAARRTYVIMCEAYGEKREYATSTRKRDIEAKLHRIAKFLSKEHLVIWHNLGYFEVTGTIKAEYWITAV